MKMLLLGLLLVLLLFWLLVRGRQSQQVQTSVRPDRRQVVSNSAYHAVSIRFAADACLAAKQIAGERFLANEAPKLPLPECNASTCKCRFAHHKDRRSGKDRRSPFAPASAMGSTGRFQTDDRREGDDRRKTDDDPDPW